MFIVIRLLEFLVLITALGVITTTTLIIAAADRILFFILLLLKVFLFHIDL